MLCAQDGVKIMNKLRLSEIAPRIIEILLEGCGYSRKVVKWNLPLLICTLRVRRHRTKQEATRQRSHLELSSKMQGAPYCCLGWRYTFSAAGSHQNLYYNLYSAVNLQDYFCYASYASACRKAKCLCAIYCSF